MGESLITKLGENVKRINKNQKIIIMQLVLKQSKSKEVKQAVAKLSASEGVKLPELAEKMGTTYQKFFQKLCASYIEVDYLEEIVKALNEGKEGRKIAIFGKELNLVFASTSGQRIELKTV